MKKIISTVLLIILSMNITACFGQSTPTKPQKPPEINSQGEYPLTVRLGEPVQETYQHNPNMFETNDAGIGMSTIRPILPSIEIPKIRIEILNIDYNPVFNISHALDVMFVSDSEYPALGVSDFMLNLPRVERCEESSILLYQQYHEVLIMLKDFGWKPYIKPHMPRILGEESWNDPNYYKDGFSINSYEKWQTYVEDDDIFVMFYRDNLILQLSIGQVNPYININTNNNEYYFRYDEETRTEKWREYLAADVKKWAAERAQAEAELREKGYTIHEEYEDAPLPGYEQ